MPNIRTDKQLVIQITIVVDRISREAVSLMTEPASFMARQPGFISISVHGSLDGRRIVSYVQWQNRDLLQAAHRSPEFRKEWSRFDKLRMKSIRIAPSLLSAHSRGPEAWEGAWSSSSGTWP